MDNQYYRKERPKQTVVSLLKKIWKKKGLRIMFFVIVPVAGFIMFSNRGVLQRIRLESDKKEIEAKIAEAQREQTELQAESKALNNDPKAIERVAREKYGMIREGETVYKVKKEK